MKLILLWKSHIRTKWWNKEEEDLQSEEDVTQDAVATLHTGKEGRVQESKSRSNVGGAKGKE